jgi:outer membrane autotransporter protein
MVLGGALGYSNQRIDFDSTRSVVGGHIHSSGYNLEVFGLYDWDGPYASMSLGVARTNYHSSRLITYPSQNILIAPVNATATGSTPGTAFNGGFELGWSFAHRGFTVEPYVNGDYQYIRLNAFHESSYNNSGPDAGKPAGFDFDYASQRISDFDATVGARLMYSLSLRRGVLVGFVRAEHHHLFNSSPGTVISTYNLIDGDYQQYAAGASFVFGHGLQAYVQYQQSVAIADVASRSASAGIRGQF